ncbi:MAG: acetyl-CoA carboxylase biotin carboxylase subunit [Planctomycetota bacterium]
MFSRILIANRGEIALRIIRACKELGIETVAVFSEADRDAAYLRLADDRICIGRGPSADSYLNIPRIIAAAEIADVQAIHPGYGFLAETSHFAEICRSCRIEFIGPSVETMQAVGDKIQAKHIARAAKVPTVPGSDGPVSTAEEAVAVANEIGYPIGLKAAAGGGGRGIRCVHNEATLHSAFRQAQGEADVAFGDGRLYVEKWIESMRHIEVQVLGDIHGNMVHLYERDCTVQRRRQKLVEEAPSPALSDKLRQEICAAAVRLCAHARYYGAGTVEFILDGDTFYFMEVNARIQVEHPVTEMLTGVDLVNWQLRIAAGEELSFKQDDIVPSGWAIECRINAEDPAADFRPCPGRIGTFVPPGGPGVRLDTHVCQGYQIPPTYDSLIGKLIVHRPTRGEAIATMRRALAEFIIDPIKTTTELYKEIMADATFIDGRFDTDYVEKHVLARQG